MNKLEKIGMWVTVGIVGICTIVFFYLFAQGVGLIN